MSDRPASILTDSQRAFVNGDNEPSNERVYKSRIRDRIESGLLDMNLLFRSYEFQEIHETFEGYAGHISKYDDAKGRVNTTNNAGVYAPGAIAFLLQGLNRKGEPIYPQLEERGIEQPAFSEFRQAIEEGVQQYLNEKTPYLADVNVSIELEGITHSDEFIDELNEPEE